MLTGQLRNDIDKLWDTFHTGGITNPLAVIEQITYLMFLERMDNVQLRKEKQANTLGKPIEEPVYLPEEKKYRWSSFKNAEPGEMHKLFTQLDDNGVNAFEKMKTMGSADSRFRRFMKNAVFIFPGDGRLLDKAVQLIDQLDVHDQDTKGDLYEYLLSKLNTAGTNGQFRTPRHIIKMMTDMVRPTPDDVVCDPAAGTMGFLVAAAEYIQAHYKDNFYDNAFKQHFNNQMFNATEFDESMIRIGAMNLLQHGIGNPQLNLTDALSEANSHVNEAFSLILANPPFKGSLDYDSVDESILRIVKSKKTELLFLGLMLRLLKIGGRAAVIVPDGVLFGSSNAHKAIRKEIIDNHNLQAIISMPSGVFKPYAGVSTAIMLFTKTGSGGTKNVWFYDMAADGYSLDDKRNPMGGENPSHEEDNIPDILNRWENLDKEAARKRTAQSFLVPVEEIRENDYDLSINRYKEIVYEKVEYEKPAFLIQQMQKMDVERNKLLNELDKMTDQWIG